MRTDHPCIGVVVAAADLVGNERDSDRCHSLLIRFFPDPDEIVRKGATRMSYEEGIPNTDNVRELWLACFNLSIP